MAIILRDRPAFRFDDTGLQIPGGLWAERPANGISAVTNAARGVGRVELEGGVLPWVGTAFVVAPRLALTAPHVASALADRTGPQSNGACWINFSSNPDKDISDRIGIEAVELVHPHWRFSFLKLAEDAPADAILELAPPQDMKTLAGRPIAVIGYSSFDQRNDAKIQNAIFANVFDEKRVSPGLILEADRVEMDDPPMLKHDASTLGGASGAPLIDVATGQVLGVHHSGQYLLGNFAARAWEARRDPQWERIWSGEMKRAAPAHGTPRPRPREIFALEELNAINDWLAQARITDEASLATLFVGLSPEFVGRLPSASNIADRLFLALGYLNDPGLKFGKKPPLYYVLTNARRHRRFEPDGLAEMDRYLEKLKALP